MKKLWNNTDIEVVEINGRWFALYGWNGEAYFDCWETDENTFALESDKRYTIKPIWEEVAEDEFELTGYKFI